MNIIVSFQHNDISDELSIYMKQII